MRHPFCKKQIAPLGLVAAALIASQAFAGVTLEEPDAREAMSVDGIHWQSPAQYQSATLVVTGPGGFRWQQSFQPGDPLFLDFEALTAGYSPGGQYKYELTFAPPIRAADRALAEEARKLGDNVDFMAAKSIPTLFGTFAIDNGAVVDPGLVETDFVKLLHASSVYIQGSLCVGFDCVNGAAFGFDTIRLQENNLRIRFDDTSVAPGFPANDWQIVINGTSNGGASFFAIQDATAGDQVFRIEAGAPSNALYVESDGDIGVGTATPVTSIHLVRGNTPTLRLAQDASSGFTPQVWDIAGNEANFFIRDATGGSTLPFRIQPGTGTNTLYLGSDEEVAIGTNSPQARFHVENTVGNDTDDFMVKSTGAVDVATTGIVGLDLGGSAGVAFRLDAGNEGTDFWQLTSTAGDAILRFNRTGGGNEMELSAAGDLTITGEITTTGSCSIGCDRVFDEDYDLPSIDTHTSEMWRDGYLPAVGPTAENGPMNLTDKVARILNELEKAHIYIGELHQRLGKLEAAAASR